MASSEQDNDLKIKNALKYLMLNNRLDRSDIAHINDEIRRTDIDGQQKINNIDLLIFGATSPDYDYGEVKKITLEKFKELFEEAKAEEAERHREEERARASIPRQIASTAQYADKGATQRRTYAFKEATSRSSHDTGRGLKNKKSRKSKKMKKVKTSKKSKKAKKIRRQSKRS
jgi:hypothetical protein